MKVFTTKPAQVAIKFYGYQGTKTVFVNQLLPYTLERKEIFDNAVKIGKLKIKQVQEKQKLQRKQATKKRLKEQQNKRMQKQIYDYREEKERYRKFGRLRLHRDDIPIPNYDLQGKIMRLSSDRIVYYVKDDETLAIIAKCFNVDIECLVYDNEVAYPEITPYIKLYALTCIVMTRIIMNGLH